MQGEFKIPSYPLFEIYKRSHAKKTRVRPKSDRQGTEAVTSTAGDNSASLAALTEEVVRQLPRGITVIPIDDSAPRRTTQSARQGTNAVTITAVYDSATLFARTESDRQGTEAVTITAVNNSASIAAFTEALVRQLPRGTTVTPVYNSAPRRSTQSARQGTDAVTITAVFNSASLVARTEALVRQLPRGISVTPVDKSAPRSIPSQDTVREVRPAVTITAIENPEEPTMTQQYSLRWNNHQPNFISMFTTLLNTQTLVDVTLSADGKQLLAHKVVLSACSTYFQTLFVENPSPHPIVILKDVTYADLRAMVDFMYCGEVNVTEEQLPQVLDTAKLLKVKGLTDMPPDSTLTRSQAPSAEFQSQGDSLDSTRHSPAVSPSNKRRRRRKSSTSSTQLNVLENEHGRADVGAQTVEAITLSSVPQQRRMREYHEIRTIDNSQQVDDTEQENMNVEPIGMENTTPAAIAQAPANPNSSDGWHRRTKHFKRQSRVPDEQNIRKQISEPLPPPPSVSKSTPALQKHESYPQYSTSKAIVTRKPRLEQEVGSLLIRAVCSTERQSSSASATSTSVSFESTASDGAQATRASHTPAVRSGPPLSCNFCWNTVDECGRILRRKTQYHCPECRTNLCIVPCFHEYHDGPESDSNNANAR